MNVMVRQPSSEPRTEIDGGHTPALSRPHELAERLEAYASEQGLLGGKRFDLAMSRFGTMFFDDPGAAFANISRALRPAGRLVMMVWQAHERNEWDVAIHQSLGAPEGPVAVPTGGPDPFSLADPPTVKKILGAAGFADVAFTNVHEPVCYRAEHEAIVLGHRPQSSADNVHYVKLAAPASHAHVSRSTPSVRRAGSSSWWLTSHAVPAVRG